MDVLKRSSIEHVGVDHGIVDELVVHFTPSTPVSVVLEIPAWIRRGRDTMLVPFPLLIIPTDHGQVEVPDDAFQFALNRAHVEKFDALRRMLVTIGSLYDFWRRSGRPMEDGEDADLAVWNYIAERLTGPKPVQYSTVRTEFDDIRTYARFCRDLGRAYSPVARALAAASRLFGKRLPMQPTAEFLQHLDVQRRRWADLLEGEAAFPADLKKLSSPSVKSGKKIVKFPTELQMDDMIDLEPNPLYRALLCLLAAQGPRLSECLQMWRCDVLPSVYASKFGASDDGNPFIIYAHPTASIWTGKSFAIRGGETRKEVLEREWSTTSSLWKHTRKDRDGWKSMLLFDRRALSWGFWAVDRYAKEFARLVPDILGLHEELGTDARHPYFWINPTDPSHRGNKMKKRNLRRVIGVACRRVGIEPVFDDGGHGHGLRHFCEWYAEKKVGMSPEEVQMVLRHQSVDSQESYGRRLSDLHAKLMGRR
ncbi:tyrosine-type recombinase/integrase [Rhizobium lusitanum]|jgi:integrase|uniref:tyrosine-type recombinase/integrase n=1 Tax=Rhizobium lusitanum TaxID=293958 RepID=UPI000DDE9D8C|nr:tyrosine-type recombinase/integrase [Rhizobium lusitanum]NTJ08227.1 tyrosine-type recombinase/integrase [Rhizobium lusitanum]